jgi:hypothetical protein
VIERGKEQLKKCEKQTWTQDLYSDTILSFMHQAIEPKVWNWWREGGQSTYALTITSPLTFTYLNFSYSIFLPIHHRWDTEQALVQAKPLWLIWCVLQEQSNLMLELINLQNILQEKETELTFAQNIYILTAFVWPRLWALSSAYQDIVNN